MPGPEFVDAKDVRFFEITEVTKGDRTYLHLRGLVFHSALAVKGIEIAAEPDGQWVRVGLTPASKGLSGAFEVDVPLLESKKNVKFGPLKTKIWPTEQR